MRLSNSSLPDDPDQANQAHQRAEQEERQVAGHLAASCVGMLIFSPSFEAAGINTADFGRSSKCAVNGTFESLISFAAVIRDSNPSTQATLLPPLRHFSFG
jgi:hypothetical protein